MWAWLKQSDSTSELQELRKENRAMRLQTARSLESLLALSLKQQESLDRVIMSKFDPPVMPNPTEQPKTIAFPDLSDVLSVEDDTEFLERTSG